MFCCCSNDILLYIVALAAAREQIKTHNEELLKQKLENMTSEVSVCCEDWLSWLEKEEEDILADNGGRGYNSIQSMLIAKFPNAIRQINKKCFNRMLDITVSQGGALIVCDVTESQASFLYGILHKNPQWIINEQLFTVVSSNS